MATSYSPQYKVQVEDAGISRRNTATTCSGGRLSPTVWLTGVWPRGSTPVRPRVAIVHQCVLLPRPVKRVQQRNTYFMKYSVFVSLDAFPPHEAWPASIPSSSLVTRHRIRLFSIWSFTFYTFTSFHFWHPSALTSFCPCCRPSCLYKER
jgi:hypothetical protein